MKCNTNNLLTCNFEVSKTTNMKINGHTTPINLYFLAILHQTFALPRCIENISNIKNEFCVTENYVNHIPDDVSIEITTFVRILNFVGLDWSENTITLFVDLMALWNDSGIVLKDK